MLVCGINFVTDNQGNQAYKEKQWHKTISLYTEAIKLCSDNATYYSNLVLLHICKSSFLQAEADCTKAINLDKKFLEMIIELTFDIIMKKNTKLLIIKSAYKPELGGQKNYIDIRCNT